MTIDVYNVRLHFCGPTGAALRIRTEPPRSECQEVWPKAGFSPPTDGVGVGVALAEALGVAEGVAVGVGVTVGVGVGVAVSEGVGVGVFSDGDGVGVTVSVGVGVTVGVSDGELSTQPGTSTSPSPYGTCMPFGRVTRADRVTLHPSRPTGVGRSTGMTSPGDEVLRSSTSYWTSASSP